VTSISHTALLWIGWTIVAVIVLDFANSMTTIVKTRIESAQAKGTLQDIQKRLDRVADDMRKQGGIIRKAFANLQKYNLRWIRSGFPGAELTNRKKR
jgi:hypothetical protein